MEDTEFSVAWVKKTLKQVAGKEPRFVVFCDNLTAQTSDNFKTAVSNLRGIVWFGVPNATDLWQHIDGGFAEQLKTLDMLQHSSQLGSDENADKWYNGKIWAKERRILITRWVGAGSGKISSPDSAGHFDGERLRKTECLINGSDDNKIKPEDISEYHLIIILKQLRLFQNHQHVNLQLSLTICKF